MKRNNAFTLIEMLVVMAMLSVVSLAVYVTFSNSLKIWQKANQEIPAQDIGIFFEKLTSDLRNTLRISGMVFAGTNEEVEFATLVNQRLQDPVMDSGRSDGQSKGEAKEAIVTVGRVRYRFDQSKAEMARQRMGYSDIHSSRQVAKDVMLQNVESLAFRYYTFDKEKQEYLWQDEWAGDGLPLAVRIELELKKDGQADKFVRTVSIPIS